MSDDLPITERITIPASDLEVSFSRSGGPGGQHVNTTDTRVRIHFKLDATEALFPGVKARLRAAMGSRITKEGEIVLTSDRFRSRSRNLDDVRERLASLIREHLVPPKIRRETDVPRSVHRKRLQSKKRRSDVKSARQKPGRED